MAGGRLKIQTKYYAVLRERLGKTSEEFELPQGSTVTDFLEKLRQVYGGVLGDLFEGGGLKTGFALALNGESLDKSLWASTRLKDGDVVVILPPIAGGLPEAGQPHAPLALILACVGLLHN